MRTHTVTLPPPPDGGAEPARELTLQFAPTRTIFLRLLDPEKAGLGSHEFFAPSALQVRMVFERPGPDASGLALKLAYEGETPSRPRATWTATSLPAARALTLWSTDALNNTRRLAIEQWKSRVQDDAIRVAEELKAARCDRLTDLPEGKHRTALEYFCHLDHATNYNFLRHDDVARQLMHEAGVDLSSRVIERQTEGAPSTSLSCKTLRELSTLQLDIAKRHFPDRQGGIDRDCFNWSYFQFAAGALVQPGRDWNARPDSAYFFLFAEFAIHAIEENVDAATWKELLPVLVHAQRLYPKAFPPYCPNKGNAVVPRRQRRFHTYQPLEKQCVPTANLVGAVERDVRNVRDYAVLKRRHAANAMHAFPKTSGPTDACAIIP